MVNKITSFYFSPQGVPINKYFSYSKEKAGANKFKDFNIFVSLCAIDGCEFSSPIILNNPFDRKSCTIFSKSENKNVIFQCYMYIYNPNIYSVNFIFQIPLSLSLIEHNNQLFLSIYNDRTPSLCINNLTDISLLVSEVQSNGKMVRDIWENNFECPNIIKSQSMQYFTPTILDSKFPDIKDIEFAIVFAVWNSKFFLNFLY